ncbi:probable calmodulin : Probable calmodulin OS=Planctomyces maris DSM 8797 GN=PM8797T_28919 PE=4 SV=1: EF-hand_5: EF-hand_5: EF-hand_7: EF-hand_5: EF-hand_5 [Gemmata massiliana]|uniref:EF-hand domain-containing protein n=1 Tax=Gemmata massiliana TaxID=1210884 RepID=A0A6P2DBE3_9BACT|nr:EF-hand domain-containing protein [Gemmata massiliana]VTR98491.1 probable calmodulin : Probable calmodulin OS=Planctomyces maris DSM 8797 GN=PM8797T_28919 PE=4 SV=1: EF-hand_5: EF-hand_5: EF-hand_7: EF-hand_5: EF-hand_5 [Gemmata massiliana]
MTRLPALLAVLVVGGTVPAADPDLVFPSGEKSARLRLEVVTDGPAPEVAWAAFLEKLFTHFDRDNDGKLSAAEAKRVFPLPLPGGREVAMDFAALDKTQSGRIAPVEFRAFYRDRGFTPVTIVNQPASAETLALSDALFRHLDRDNDGKLSAAELRRATGLLQRFDENEDEVLTAAELLGEARDTFKSEPTGLKLVPVEKNVSDAKLRLALSGKSTLSGAGSAFELSATGDRLRVPGGTCALSVTKADPATAFRTAKNFYLAQFKAITGDKPAPKRAFDDDSTAQVLAGLFDSADRDGDGKLTRAELEAFFDLIELGVACRVLVTVTDRGRNLFGVFDTNGDGRLDLDELIRAGRTLPNEFARDKSLERGAVPTSYQLIVSRGPAGESFGPVPFGAAPKPKPPVPPVARGPAWFRAMDKNGDGYVSAREFIGAPELFAKLDANGDGRISVEEAETAKL